MVEEFGADLEGLGTELKSFGTEKKWFGTELKEEQYSGGVAWNRP